MQCLDLHCSPNLHYKCTILTPRPNGEFPELPNPYVHLPALAFYLLLETRINLTKYDTCGMTGVSFILSIYIYGLIINAVSSSKYKVR
jgi:hypothetical protein